METVAEKLELLGELRDHPDRYLPMTGHAWKTFPKRDDGTEWYDDPVYNIGWDAGLLPGNRPYFLECWATCGITMLTVSVSAEGIGDAEDAALVRMLEEAGLFRVLDPSNPRAAVMKYEDGGHEFFSVNITVGDEENTYAEGGRIFGFRFLNEFNRKKGRRPE